MLDQRAELDPIVRSDAVRFGPGHQLDTLAVDTNHDGRPDLVEFDRNHDGHVDEVDLDRNHDGQVDEVIQDQNYDGRPDTVTVDANFDGKADYEATDTNNDGHFDTVHYDEPAGAAHAGTDPHAGAQANPYAAK